MNGAAEPLPDLRRRKRRLALWSALPAVGALAVAAKLASVGLLGGSAAGSFEAGNATDVGNAAAWLKVANVLEPHKAHFASGDAHALTGDFAAARSDFEDALAAGPGNDECKARINLALSIEKLGDAAAASDVPKAAGLFAEALGVVESAPAGCHAAGPANAEGEGKDLDAAKERLNGKRGASSDGGSGRPSSSSQAPAPKSEQLQQLQDSAQRAQQERTKGQERDEYLRGPDNGGGVDRPW
ncbi:hypothetical protein ACIPY2_03435 [Paenarthrobacter sp. NPDC089675]|uniref:hypothetical protein n=1 Tax=Paenarthrobacter sp. NPDC089675 TaxID=3364376 RepID=UPI003821FFB0